MRGEVVQRDIVEYYEELFHNKKKVMQVIYDAFGDPIYVPPGKKKKVTRGRVIPAGPPRIRRLRGKDKAIKVLSKEEIKKEVDSDAKRRDTEGQDKTGSGKSANNRDK